MALTPSKPDAPAGAPGSIGPGARLARSDATDAWLVDLLRSSSADPSQCCLVAVGGYGRRELSPRGDLDLLLLHRGDGEAAAMTAEALWYPIWDAGLGLDHSVRTVAQARRLAADDIRVLLGLLDARAIAGDVQLVDQLRQAVYADWRAMAPRRLPQLRELVDERRRRHGDLATMLEPDLKQAYGGLREATVLRAIAASWLTDIDHVDWEQGVPVLLDVRDGLQQLTGRASTVLLLQEQPGVAELLCLADADDLLRRVYAAARALAHACDAAWYRAERSRPRAPRVGKRAFRRGGQVRVPLADGVVVQEAEVVLASDADPARDPVLVLRAAAAAAQAGLHLAPHAIHRLATEGAEMPVPWSATARDAFVSLLGAGQSLVFAWEALDQAGIIEHLIPGWAVVRSAPQRNAMHRFTVDRHLVETAVQAHALTQQVQRPDLLLIAALLHDFGKARGGDHSAVGADLAGELVARMGLSAADGAIVVRLVRFHLLLADTATRRDLEDPVTVASVAEAVQDEETLDLLAALTQADSLATGPGMWTQWKRSLIEDLVARVHAVLVGRPLPEPPDLSQTQLLAWRQPGVWVLVTDGELGSEVTVAAPDRVGLLATVAGVMSLHRLQVRSARVRTVDDRALQVWVVEPSFGEPPSADRLAQEIRRALDGSLDIAALLAARDADYRLGQARLRAAARVEFIEGSAALAAADRPAILQVRAHDAPGLLHRIASAIAHAGAMITGAKVATLGSEAVDVFFLAERSGCRLDRRRHEDVLGAVRAALAD